LISLFASIKLWYTFAVKCTYINSRKTLFEHVLHTLKNQIMAKPIKETPVLTGMDAVKFRQQMAKNRDKVVPAAVKERIKENYNKLAAIADFSF
jgi:hypothetical protein